MRFILAFVAILVVSWASNGEGTSIPEGFTGAHKSVKELAGLYESSRIVNPNRDDNDEDAEVIAETGKKMTVKDLVASYEKFQKSDSWKEKAKSEDLPTLQQVMTAIKTGKAFNPECVLCRMGAGTAFGKQKPTKEWWEFLCF